MRVLLVDDNKSTTKLMSKFLESEPSNYQIGVVNNGLQALDYYPSFKPDVVVLDISMPGMDGIETLSRLFKIDKDVNVIMASATDSLRTVEICLQKGAMGYISKPYSPEELVTSIQNAQKGGMYKRDLTVFFTRTAKKLEAVIHKITNTSVMITFEDIEITPNYSSSMMNLASVRSVKNEINEIKIEIDNNCTAYSTEIGGQIDGTIVSAINKNDLRLILDGTIVSAFTKNDSQFILDGRKYNTETINFGDLALEFFTFSKISFTASSCSTFSFPKILLPNSILEKP